jgi:hypothetical protein
MSGAGTARVSRRGAAAGRACGAENDGAGWRVGGRMAVRGGHLARRRQALRVELGNGEADWRRVGSVLAREAGVCDLRA